MKELLYIGNIRLRPAKLSDKRNVFNWLTNSNLTKEMMGYPKFSDVKIPTWKEFHNDYLDFYFDGSKLLKGQSFIIIENENEVGHINYNGIDEKEMSTFIDIWLKEKTYTGRGIGTKAIEILSNYLLEKFKCRRIYVAPSSRNITAIKSYKKAGFRLSDIVLSDSEKDYHDYIVLVKIMKH